MSFLSAQQCKQPRINELVVLEIMLAQQPLLNETTFRQPYVTERELWSNLQPLLDNELSLLPDKYRVVIVLCDLEGKTRPEAARQLGLPEGTVASPLARARTMLAKRLARHGLAVSGGTMAAVLSQEAAAGAVPTSVLVSTIKAVTSVAAGQAVAGLISIKVATLAKGVLKAMFLTKLKIASMVLLMMAVVAGGAGGLAYYAQATEPVIQQAEAEPKNIKAERPVAEPAEVQADVEAQKRLDRLKVEQAQTWLAKANIDRAKEKLLVARDRAELAAKNFDDAKIAYEQAKEHLEKLNRQGKDIARAAQADEEEQKRKDEERKRKDKDIEEEKLRDLFHNGKVEVFIDGDTQKPSIKGARFHSIVELSGRRFLRFSRLGDDGREERLLIDPARIVSVRIPE